MSRLICRVAVALVVWSPLCALAQDVEDEFYQDEDLEDPEEGGGEAGDADVALDAEVDDGELNRFGLSTFTYENIFSARPRSADLSSDATFYYAMSYSFRPRFHITEWSHLRLRFDLEQELTNSGSTTYRYEPIASDTSLGIWFTDVLDSMTDVVDLSAYFNMAFPSSKASQARSLIMGTSLGLGMAHTFPVLEGLTLSYGFRATKYWNRYTTARQEAPTLSCTPGADMDCESQINLGTRNPSWLLRNSLGLAFVPVEGLTFSVNVSWYSFFLYGVAPADCHDLSAEVHTVDPSQCPIASQPENTDMRVSLWYIVELGYDIFPWLNVAIGTSTFNPQLTPSSEYRAPFFNRFTNFYFDINITVDALVQSIAGPSSNRGADEVEL